MNISQQWLSASIVDMLSSSTWLNAALALAFFSTWVVIGVFAYLNHHTKRSHFSLWTVGWLFYAVWLGVSIGMDESLDVPSVIMAQRACIGISALFMFWGCLELNNCGRLRSELWAGVALMFVWSYVAAYEVCDPFWISVPVFVLLAAASGFIGWLYWPLSKQYRGARLLAVGFTLWGVHLLGFPFMQFLSPVVVGCNHIVSAVLSVLIALGMVVLVVEQARQHTASIEEKCEEGVVTRLLLKQEAQDSEQKYRALFDAASDAIFLVDLATLEIVEANKAATHFLLGPAGPARRSFAELCPGLRGRGGRPEENQRLFETLTQGGQEFQLLRADGQPVVCEGSVNLVQYNHRPILQINVRDITARRRLEQQVRRSEKLSALGQMIAGVAHELNNPLAVIMGYAQLLTKQPPNGSQPKTEPFKILHESERAAKIVRNLLTFANPREPQLKPADLNQLVGTIVELYEQTLRDNQIVLRKRLAADLPLTMADPDQIEQVLTNLVVNAMQALASHPGPREVEFVTEQNGDHLRVIVADNGPGIAPEVASRIFDPFFSTKAPGKGSGLGLSICHSIVEEHRGRLWVQSEPGKGTKFFIELPLVPCAEPVAPMPVEIPVIRRSVDARRRRLLVVDDEPGVVEVLRAVLESNGYMVEVAANGTEALERLQADRYDLIISDLYMPGMDGETLYKCLRDTNPDLAQRMIFVSGDTVSPRARNFVESAGNRWLAKPFNLSEIERMVGDFLESAPEIALNN